MNDNLTQFPPAQPAAGVVGESHDGTGAGDQDRPYGGFRAYPFKARELTRLLVLRSDILDGRLGLGRFAEDMRSR